MRNREFAGKLGKKIPACMATLTLFLAVALAGCEPSSPAHDASMYPSEIEALAVDRQKRNPLVKSQMRGRKTYQHYCAICHGADADGNGFNAAMLDPPPRNFTDPDFLKWADSDRLFQVIHDGGTAVDKSVLMPAWGRTLNERQIRDVVAFLRTLAAPAASAGDETE